MIMRKGDDSRLTNKTREDLAPQIQAAQRKRQPNGTVALRVGFTRLVDSMSVLQLFGKTLAGRVLVATGVVEWPGLALPCLMLGAGFRWLKREFL